MNITEKSAYLKGLAEGLQLDTTKPEAKVITALLDLVADLTQKVAEIEEDTEMLNDYIEEIDEDLGYVEDLVYDDEDDDDEDEEDEDDFYECDLDCAHCTHPEDCEDDEDEEDEEGFRCLMCPSCSEKIYFDESMDPSDLICPACGKAVCEDEDEDADDVK